MICRDEDVSKIMYKDTLPSNLLRNGNEPSEEKRHTQQLRSAKVNRICDAFLVALKRRSPTHMQTIITAHVCKVPSDLEAGLLEVSKLQVGESDKVKSAIEHICFLVDVNKLYDTALGLYNLELTLLVAQNSQKDPRENIPFLQSLQSQPPLRMQFAIDDHLKRHAKALEHLFKLNVFEEFMAYTERHALYLEALEMQRYKEANLRDVTRIYAGYLYKTAKFQDAGYAFEQVGEYQSASEAYQLAHLWQESLACAAMVPHEPAQMRPLATSIADSLIELKQYSAAATITLDYLDDVEASVQLHCRGYQFSEAIRIVMVRNRPELLETVVDKSLIESQGTITELLAECKNQLNAQVPRIRELRQKKSVDPMGYFGAEAHGESDIPDDVSLAPTDASTTGGSLFTRYTNNTGTIATDATRRTAKNKRREERKRAMGKKGSIYEEQYLVNSVSRIVRRVNDTNEDARNLVLCLTRRAMRERAKVVEAAMVAVTELCGQSVREVFESGD